MGNTKNPPGLDIDDIDLEATAANLAPHIDAAASEAKRCFKCFESDIEKAGKKVFRWLTNEDDSELLHDLGLDE